MCECVSTRVRAWVGVRACAWVGVCARARVCMYTCVRMCLCPATRGRLHISYVSALARVYTPTCAGHPGKLRLPRKRTWGHNYNAWRLQYQTRHVVPAGHQPTGETALCEALDNVFFNPVTTLSPTGRGGRQSGP